MRNTKFTHNEQSLKIYPTPKRAKCSESERAYLDRLKESCDRIETNYEYFLKQPFQLRAVEEEE